MKARYILVICIISLIVNVISVYNILLGFCSLLLLLITFVPALYVRIVNQASKVKESERTFATRQLANYGSQGTTRTMNRFAVIFGLVVVYGMAIGSLLFQRKSWDNMGQFISNNLNVGHLIGVAQTLSGVGWALFILSLLLVTLYIFRLMKKEAIFAKKK